ncbi:MAG: Uncharacterized protein XD91_0493 [Clostridiales bacterium 38_11]|nr:MAG: Uncharacterized protein XD91_0493 [Clostridiales bacterium 38_11]HBH13620.1 carotenoid oxygenase [Clostridiales bacterium]
MKYKYVIFDFDGTLADTEDINFTIYLDLADKYKLKKISKSDMGSLKKMSAFDLIDYLDIKKRNIPAMIRFGRKILHGSIENIDMCKPTIAEVMLKLKDNDIILGILTSNSKKNVNKFIEKHQLMMFTFIENSGMFGKERVFQKLLRRYNINKDEVLYVGDEIRDITATKNIGIDIASVDWGYNSRDGLEKNKPKYLISEPEELLEICLNHKE